jgi:ribosome-associated translation inhibitor RaiA
MVTGKDIVHNYIKPIGTTTSGERVGEKVERFAGSLGDIMDDRPLYVRPVANSNEVIKKIKERGKSACLITLKDERIVGIVTPREFLKPLIRFRGEGELPVYIVGLSEAGNFFERAIVEDKIRRVVRRAVKMHPHLSEISITIKPSRTGGVRTRYEVSVNVYSKATEEQFDIDKDGWDLMRVFDELSDALDRVLRESKHEPESLSKEEKLFRHSLWFKS